jgi:WD40 repeat protein
MIIKKSCGLYVLYSMCALLLQTPLCSMQAEQTLKITFTDADDPFEIPLSMAKESAVLKSMIEDFESLDEGIEIASTDISKATWTDMIAPALEKLALEKLAAATANASNTNASDTTAKENPIQSHVNKKFKEYEDTFPTPSPKNILEKYSTTIHGATYLDIPELLDASIQSFAQYLKEHEQDFLNTPDLLKQLEAFAPDMQKKIMALFPVVAISDLISIKSSEGSNSIAFQPRGTILASGSWDTTIKLWDIQNPKNPQLLTIIDEPNKGHSGAVKSVAFNPGGTILASGSADSTIKLWDIQNPKNPQLLTTIDEIVTRVAFNPGGTVLASGSEDKTIKLWDIQNPQNPQLLATIDQSNNGHSSIVSSIAFNPVRATIASGSWDTTIKLWDIHDPYKPQLLATIDQSNNGHSQIVDSVTFNPEGTILASGSWDTTIKLWDIQNPQNPQLLTTIDRSNNGHSEAVKSVAFSPQATVLASGSWDTTIKLWNIQNSKKPVLLTESKQRDGYVIMSIAFNPQGTILASGYYDNPIELWIINDIKNLTLTQFMFLYSVRNHFGLTNSTFTVPTSGFLRELIATFPDTERSYLKKFIID